MADTVRIPNDSTLHHPRILCLHGGGTNARIFRAQCRVLEKALRSHFRLCYAQAPFYSRPGPDVVSVYEKYGPFRAWFESGADREFISEELDTSIRTAMTDDDRKGATGDFVGLLGFSQGAKIGASLLLDQQICKAAGVPSSMPTWKFAVLLAGRGPLLLRIPKADSYSTTHILDPRSATIPTGKLLKVPTAHVHGLRDAALDLHRKFSSESFDQRHTRVIEWDGEHRVPIRSKDVAAVVQEILRMAKHARLFRGDAGWISEPLDSHLVVDVIRP